MILVSIYAAYAQPSLAFDRDVDKVAMKSLLSEIPESYVEGITTIYFSKSPYKYDKKNQMTIGMFYKNSITLFNVNSFSKEKVREVLLHELGHNEWTKLSKAEQEKHCGGLVTDACEEEFADGLAELNINVSSA